MVSLNNSKDGIFNSLFLVDTVTGGLIDIKKYVAPTADLADMLIKINTKANKLYVEDEFTKISTKFLSYDTITQSADKLILKSNVEDVYSKIALDSILINYDTITKTLLKLNDKVYVDTFNNNNISLNEKIDSKLSILLANAKFDLYTNTEANNILLNNKLNLSVYATDNILLQEKLDAKLSILSSNAKFDLYTTTEANNILLNNKLNVSVYASDNILLQEKLDAKLSILSSIAKFDLYTTTEANNILLNNKVSTTAYDANNVLINEKFLLYSTIEANNILLNNKLNVSVYATDNILLQEKLDAKLSILSSNAKFDLYTTTEANNILLNNKVFTATYDSNNIILNQKIDNKLSIIDANEKFLLYPTIVNNDVALFNKADKTTTYTKSEVDNIIGQQEPLFTTKEPLIKNLIIKDDGSLGISLELTSEFTDLVNSKRSILESFNKVEINDKLALKRDITDSYNKAETDGLIDTIVAAGSNAAATLKAIADSLNNDLNFGSNILNQLASKAPIISVYNKTEIDDKLLVITTKEIADVADLQTQINTKINTDVVYTKDNINATVLDINNKLLLKMNITDAYNQTEINDKLLLKCDKLLTYSINDINNIISNFDNRTVSASAYATIINLNLLKDSLYNKVEIDTILSFFDNKIVSGSLYETKSNIDLLKLSLYTKGEIDNIISFFDNKTVSASMYATLLNTYNKLEIDNKFIVSNDLINTKANKNETYTKSEIDNFDSLFAISLNKKADKLTSYLRSELDEFLINKADKNNTYTKEEINTHDIAFGNALNNKADKINSYLKSEIDAFLLAKSNSNNTYTKSEIDTTYGGLSNSKADKDDTYLKSTGELLLNFYDKTQINEIVANLNLILNTKITNADLVSYLNNYYTKSEINFILTAYALGADLLTIINDVTNIKLSITSINSELSLLNNNLDSVIGESNVNKNDISNIKNNIDSINSELTLLNNNLDVVIGVSNVNTTAIANTYNKSQIDNLLLNIVLLDPLYRFGYNADKTIFKIERFSTTSNVWFELLALNFDSSNHCQLYIDKTNITEKINNKLNTSDLAEALLPYALINNVYTKTQANTLFCLIADYYDKIYIDTLITKINKNISDIVLLNTNLVNANLILTSHTSSINYLTDALNACLTLDSNYTITNDIVTIGLNTFNTIYIHGFYYGRNIKLLELGYDTDNEQFLFMVNGINIFALIAEKLSSTTLANALLSYVTSTGLTSTLLNYKTVTSFNTDINNYKTKTSFTSDMLAYQLISGMPNMSLYQLISGMSNYKTVASFNSDIANYLTVALFNTKMTDYVTIVALTTLLAEYMKTSDFTSLTNSVTNINTYNNNNTTNITNLTNNVSTNTTDISTVNNTVNNHTTAINNLTTSNNTNTTNINNLTTLVNNHDTSIGTINTKINNVYTKTDVYTKAETLGLTQTQWTSEYPLKTTINLGTGKYIMGLDTAYAYTKSESLAVSQTQWTSEYPLKTTINMSTGKYIMGLEPTYTPFYLAGKIAADGTIIANKGRYSFVVVKGATGSYNITPSVNFDNTYFIVTATTQNDGATSYVRVNSSLLSVSNITFAMYVGGVSANCIFHFSVIA